MITIDKLELVKKEWNDTEFAIDEMVYENVQNFIKQNKNRFNKDCLSIEHTKSGSNGLRMTFNANNGKYIGRLEVFPHGIMYELKMANKKKSKPSSTYTLVKRDSIFFYDSSIIKEWLDEIDILLQK